MTILELASIAFRSRAALAVLTTAASLAIPSAGVAEAPSFSLEAGLTAGLESGRAAGQTVVRRARSTVRVGLDRDTQAEIPVRVGAALRLEIEGGFFLGIEPVVRLAPFQPIWLILRAPIWLLPHSLAGISAGLGLALGKLELGLSAGGYAIGSDLPRDTAFGVIELSVGGRLGL